jgi:DNA-binding NtrC family response regulator
MNNEAVTDTVLLVDDEPNVSSALKRALMHEPFEFLSATSGEQALEIMAEHPVHVVVADEQMPGMQGSQLLAIVRRRYPRVVRFILSGQATLESAVRAINDGEVHRFFLKPCNAVDLSFSIKQAVVHQLLTEQSRNLLRSYQKQASLIGQLQRKGSDLLRLDTDTQGALVFDPEDLEVDATELLAEIEGMLHR